MADQWRPYDAPGDDAAPPPPPPQPWQYAGGATYPAYDAGSERRRIRARIALLVVGGIMVLGGAAAGIVALVVNALDSDDSATSTTTTTTTTTRTEVHVDGTGSVDLFSTAGTEAMTEALVRETGSPRVLEVVLLKVNAVLTVPGDAGPRTLVWDGTSMTAGGPGVSDRKPFDLADLDGAVVGRLCGDQPLTCTAIVGRPRPSDNGAWITIAGLDGVHFTDLQGKKP